MQGNDSLEMVTNEQEDPESEKCDVNRDGHVDVADIATVIDRMAQLSRRQKEIEE